VWQAGGELSGIGAAGRFQRESATTGAYPQTGQFDDAFLVGGSGPGDGAQRAGVAQQVSPPDDAARTENRQGRDGPQAGGSSDFAPAPGSEVGERLTNPPMNRHEVAKIGQLGRRSSATLRL